MVGPSFPAGIEALTVADPHLPALVYGSCSVISIWLVAAIVTTVLMYRAHKRPLSDLDWFCDRVDQDLDRGTR